MISSTLGKTAPVHPSFLNRPASKGRCFDLTKAYKQVPISQLSLKLGVLLVHDPAAPGPRVFHVGASSLFSFNRISRSLLHLKRCLLSLVCGSYFDDFPYLESELLTGIASRLAESLLSALGWLCAHDAEKGKDLAPTVSLLGVQLDLTSLHLGSFSLANKDSRKARLEEQFHEMVSGHGSARHVATSVHGVLNFMNGAALGHRLKLPCHAFANLSNMHEDPDLSVLEQLRAFALSSLEDLRPKQLGPMRVRTPVLIFTDGAYENGRATWGAVILDTHTQTAAVHHGEVPRSPLGSCEPGQSAGDLSGGELRHAYADLMHNRYCLHSMLALAQAFYLPEADKPSCTWIDRIPSASNIADWPSRGEHESAAKAISGFLWATCKPRNP